MQAKDIPDERFLTAIRECSAEHGGPMGGAIWWDVSAALGVPDKVAQAKARKLIKRGVLGGCACGCRGDWYIKTPDGSTTPEDADD